MPEWDLPIYTPKEFNTLLGEKEFADRIGGCSTFSLSFITQVYSEGIFYVPTYHDRFGDLHVHMDLRPRVFRRVFGRNPFGRSLRKSILYNREYGTYWSFFELYRELVKKDSSFQDITDEDIEIDHLEMDNSYPWVEFVRAYQRTKLKTANELIDSSDILTRDRLESRAMVRRFFRSNENLVFVLDGLNQRKGVQVIYGGQQELIDFITDPSSKAEYVDDSGVRIARNVPNELIQCLVPLGRYERAYFANKI